ncbi:hypothetical protein EVAR_75073_1 [Eumeta japonica]|uniref:Uncharacterized protein n=1 Tax=Eumeta variegata TaxID=151549 RepID=A0A4C1VZD6_EUMVA|nr:hypothetical protein EVAR_75073_1 [Eumeta japonica]
MQAKSALPLASLSKMSPQRARASLGVQNGNLNNLIRMPKLKEARVKLRKVNLIATGEIFGRKPSSVFRRCLRLARVARSLRAPDFGAHGGARLTARIWIAITN